MASHCNHTAIVPVPLSDRYHVAIVRGVMANGNPYMVCLDYIAHDLSLDDAEAVARGAMNIERLNPLEYVRGSDERPPYNLGMATEPPRES